MFEKLKRRRSILLLFLILLIIVSEALILRETTQLRKRITKLERTIKLSRFELNNNRRANAEFKKRIMNLLAPWKGRILHEAEENVLNSYRENIQKVLVSNGRIGTLIKSEPVLGGKWGVYTSNNIIFLTPDVLFVNVENGHTMVRLILRVEDPKDITTWKVLAEFGPGNTEN